MNAKCAEALPHGRLRDIINMLPEAAEVIQC